MVAADFNIDGKVDLATANYDGSTVSLLVAEGNGTYQPKKDYATGLRPQALFADDLNADGRVDLVTVNYDKGTLSVLLGTCLE